MSGTMRQRRRQLGLTLPELMISMTLGLLILLGLTSLFVESKRSFKQDELVSRMQEDARFAMSELQRDIAMGGFWADVLDPSPIVNVSTGLTGSLYTYTPPAELFDNAVAGITPLGSALANLRTGTDVIALRKLAGFKAASVPESGTDTDVANAKAALTAGNVYLQTNGVVARMMVKNDSPTTIAGSVVPAAFNYWSYEPVIYFVRNYYTNVADGIPTLCRRVLSGTTLATECLAAGVEDLQIEYGVDTNGDKYADEYIAAPTSAQMSNVTSVRIWLLMRSTDQDTNYKNTHTYTISNSAIAPSSPNDGYYRRVYSTTIMVRNNAHLMALT